jgi:hypothetical protein
VTAQVTVQGIEDRPQSVIGIDRITEELRPDHHRQGDQDVILLIAVLVDEDLQDDLIRDHLPDPDQDGVQEDHQGIATQCCHQEVNTDRHEVKGSLEIAITGNPI